MEARHGQDLNLGAVAHGGGRDFCSARLFVLFCPLGSSAGRAFGGYRPAAVWDGVGSVGWGRAAAEVT